MIFAGLLVHKNLLAGNANLAQGNDLAVLVLLACTDPDIAVCI